MASARPSALGSAIVLFADQSAAALAPRPPETGQFVFETLFHSSVNRLWQSALARVVPPELALPMVPSFIITQPASATVLNVTLTSPVVNAPTLMSCEPSTAGRRPLLSSWTTSPADVPTFCV